MLRKSGISEHPDPVGLTQPDQVKPLEMILKHQAQGIPVPQFNGVYLGDDKEPLELYKMDAIEINQFRAKLLDDMEVLEKDYHESTRKLAELEKQQMERSTASDPKGSATEGSKTRARSDGSPSGEGAE